MKLAAGAEAIRRRRNHQEVSGGSQALRAGYDRRRPIVLDLLGDICDPAPFLPFLLA
jgi:hypothetical protein